MSNSPSPSSQQPEPRLEQSADSHPPLEQATTPSSALTLEDLGVFAPSPYIAETFLSAAANNPDIVAMRSKTQAGGHDIMTFQYEPLRGNLLVSHSTERGRSLFTVQLGASFDYGKSLEESAVRLYTEAFVQIAMQVEGLQTLNAENQLTVERPDGQIRPYHLRSIFHMVRRCEQMNFLLDNGYSSSVPTMFDSIIGAKPGFTDQSSRDAAWEEYRNPYPPRAPELRWVYELQYAAVCALMRTMDQHPSTDSLRLRPMIAAASSGADARYDAMPEELRKTMRILADGLFERTAIVSRAWYDPIAFEERAMLLLEAAERPLIDGMHAAPPDSFEAFLAKMAPRIEERRGDPREPHYMKVHLPKAA